MENFPRIFYKLKKLHIQIFVLTLFIYYGFTNFALAQISYVPFFSQNNPIWSYDQLGTCVGWYIGYPNPANDPKRAAGCATTCKAMVFNYFFPNYTNPGQLNICLRDNNGYESGCLIPWDSRNNNCAPPGVSFINRYEGDISTLSSLIDSELLKGYPVIADVRFDDNIQHFVLITGKFGVTYYINDPWDLNFICRTLENGSLGAYTLTAIFLFRGPVRYPLSGDWDADGGDTFGYFEDNVFYLDNEHTIPFGVPGDYPIVGDWDGDGKDDIGVFRAKEEGVDQSTFYLELLNDGEFGGEADYTIPFGYWPNDIAVVGDWDGDGDDDIGGYYPANSTFYLYLIDLNTSTAVSHMNVPFGQSCDYPISGDWDCDGDDDIGVFRARDPNENTNNFYFDINLTGYQGEYDVTDFGSNGYGNIGDIPVIGDWDGDGDDNIGVYRPSDSGSPFDKFYTNSNIPNISPCYVFDGHDFTGDGTSDISVWRASNGIWYIKGLPGQGWGQAGDIPVNGDYDGDNITDIAVFRPSTGRWYIKGVGGFGWGTSEDIPVPGHYGGGATNIAVFRPSTGKWYIRGIGGFGWGAPGDMPVPGDYNGDGVTDLAIWRPSTGRWYIKGVGGFGWGADGDIPVPGDYNGDGVTDIAVWRPSNGRWYIRGVGGFGWGVAGDIPVPGDYNGDGVTDIAVWRPSNGHWYIRGQTGAGWGKLGDIPLVR